MKKLLILFFTFCVGFVFSQNIRYATTTGNSSNDGLSEATAWSLLHGLNQLSANMTLYVKAGNYGALQRTLVGVSGTQSQPIKIIGYKNTPGDIVATNGCTLNTGGIPDVNESPVLMGTTTTNRPDQNQGLVFTDCDYLEFSNFAAFSYSQPLNVKGEGAKVDNWYSYKSGNHNPPDFGGFSNNFPDGVYLGWGIIIQGDNHRLTNTYVLDAGAEGIKVQNADNFYHENNVAESILGVGPIGNFNASDGNGTDYHYLFGGNCSNGVVKNATARNANGKSAEGHGIVVKTPNSSSPVNNLLIDGFYVENTKIEVQFPNSTNITFDNGRVHSTDDVERRKGHDANIANGGFNVVVKNTRFTGGTGVKLRGWVDIYNLTYPQSIDGGKILNCSFEGDGNSIPIWITHGPGNNDTHQARNVVFEHCTFDNFSYLLLMSSDFLNIDFVNNSFSNIPNYFVIGYHDGPGPAGGTGGPYPFFGDWDTNNFFNSFTPNSGGDTNTNATGLNPSLDSEYKVTNVSLLTASVTTSNFSGGLSLGYLGGGTSPPPTGNSSEIIKAKNSNVLIN